MLKAMNLFNYQPTMTADDQKNVSEALTLSSTSTTPSKRQVKFDQDGSTSFVDESGEDQTDEAKRKSRRKKRDRSLDRLNALEEKVFRFESQLNALDQIPSNSELIDRAKQVPRKTSDAAESTSKTGASRHGPILEVWQYTQMEKRIESAENGITRVRRILRPQSLRMHWYCSSPRCYKICFRTWTIWKNPTKTSNKWPMIWRNNRMNWRSFWIDWIKNGTIGLVASIDLSARHFSVFDDTLGKEIGCGQFGWKDSKSAKFIGKAIEMFITCWFALLLFSELIKKPLRRSRKEFERHTDGHARFNGFSHLGQIRRCLERHPRIDWKIVHWRRCGFSLCTGSTRGSGGWTPKSNSEKRHSPPSCLVLQSTVSISSLQSSRWVTIDLNRFDRARTVRIATGKTTTIHSAREGRLSIGKIIRLVRTVRNIERSTWTIASVGRSFGSKEKHFACMVVAVRTRSFVRRSDLEKQVESKRIRCVQESIQRSLGSIDQSRTECRWSSNQSESGKTTLLLFNYCASWLPSRCQNNKKNNALFSLSSVIHVETFRCFRHRSSPYSTENRWSSYREITA